MNPVTNPGPVDDTAEAPAEDQASEPAIVEGTDPYLLPEKWTGRATNGAPVTLTITSGDGGVTYAFTGQALEQLLLAVGFTPIATRGRNTL